MPRRKRFAPLEFHAQIGAHAPRPPRIERFAPLGKIARRNRTAIHINRAAHSAGYALPRSGFE
jgi:hypothetical protein